MEYEINIVNHFKDETNHINVVFEIKKETFVAKIEKDFEGNLTILMLTHSKETFVKGCVICNRKHSIICPPLEKEKEQIMKKLIHHPELRFVLIQEKNKKQ